MRAALTQLLFARHPDLFALRNSPEGECPLADWGFEHDDGWFGVTAALAEVIAAGAPRARVWQWKSKFTSLRVSLEDGNDFCTGAINAADAVASRISERSGRPGRQYIRRGRFTQVLTPEEAEGFPPANDAHNWLEGTWIEQRLRDLHPDRLNSAVILWPEACLFIADSWLSVLPPGVQVKKMEFGGDIELEFSGFMPQADLSGALALLLALTRRVDPKSGCMVEVDDAGRQQE